MIRQKLQEDMVAALKNKNAVILNTLRYVISKVKNREIEKKTELDDSETTAVLRKIAKELKESVAIFKSANRQDLLMESQKQLDIILKYLPQEISDEELRKEIKRIKQENQELYNKNPKSIIGICIKTLKDKADSSRIIKLLNDNG